MNTRQMSAAAIRQPNILFQRDAPHASGVGKLRVDYDNQQKCVYINPNAYTVRKDILLQIIVSSTYRFRVLLVLGIACCPTWVTGGEPVRNVKYDTKHERNVLDFWPAPPRDEPSPVFVWFHGGGFRNGDKTQLDKNRASMLKAYQQAGYAVISCNYPFLSNEIDHLTIARHCARAVQFIRSQADAWHIDPKRLCCGGVSAGALISEFLAYHDDFAVPQAEDAVSRQSSRPAVVVSVMQPRGTQQFVLRFMDKGEAPIFIYSNAKPTDHIHPPWAAIMLRDKAQKLGIPCVAWGGGRNKLPKVKADHQWLDLQLEFCQRHLSAKKISP